MSAQEIRAWRNLAKKLVVNEERTKLLGILQAKGVGLRDEEEFFRNEKSKFKKGGTAISFEKKSKEIIAQTMKLKIKDCRLEWEGIRKMRNRKMNKVQALLGPNSRKCRWVMNDIKKNCEVLRVKMRKKFKDKAILLVDR